MDRVIPTPEPVDAAEAQPMGDFLALPDSAGALNARERQLLDWLAAGRTNAQIGRCAGRSEKTIRNRLTCVYAKLGVVNRSESVAVYLRMQFQTERELAGVGGD